MMKHDERQHKLNQYTDKQNTSIKYIAAKFHKERDKKTTTRNE
jgi:hypothetical protein